MDRNHLLAFCDYGMPLSPSLSSRVGGAKMVPSQDKTRLSCISLPKCEAHSLRPDFMTLGPDVFSGALVVCQAGLLFLTHS